MDEKLRRSLELAKQMPDMTYSEWRLLSKLINDLFERAVETMKRDVEKTALLSTAMAETEDNGV